MNGFNIKKTEKGFEAAFSSTWENVEKGVSEAVDFIKQTPLKIDLFAFRLSLLETLSNAAKHGNNMNPEKDVIFKLELKSSILRIQIEDSGNGFDWEKALNKDALDYETPSGRGLMLLKAYGYMPKYNKKGNALVIEKILE